MKNVKIKDIQQVKTTCNCKVRIDGKADIVTTGTIFNTPFPAWVIKELENQKTTLLVTKKKLTLSEKKVKAEEDAKADELAQANIKLAKEKEASLEELEGVAVKLEEADAKILELEKKLEEKDEPPKVEEVEETPEVEEKKAKPTLKKNK